MAKISINGENATASGFTPAGLDPPLWGKVLLGDAPMVSISLEGKVPLRERGATPLVRQVRAFPLPETR